MEFKDYYATLGVSRNAPPDEVKAAFRKLARKHHPDVNPGDPAAEERFKTVNEAYEVLGNPDTRRQYDELGANWKMYEQARGAGHDPFAAHGPFPGDGPGTRARTVSEDEFRRVSDGDPFSDFFRTFFGDAHGATGAGSVRAARRGGDIEHTMELTLDQAFSGVTRRITLRSDGDPHTVDVRIPPGVDDESRVRVAGEGRAGRGGAASGDLYLRLRIAPHPVYTRKGRDLYMRATLPLTTAVLGGEATIGTIAGDRVRLKVPPATQQGQVFRIKGHGMPVVPGGGARGDLYATAHVQLPRSVSGEARKHFEALAALENPAGSRERPGHSAE